MSSLRLRLGHTALRMAVAPAHRRFSGATGQLEATQRALLAGLLQKVARVRGGELRDAGNWNWEQFSARLPVTGWNDWATLVDAQQRMLLPMLIDSPLVRYQPTSGSTAAIKQIPYTQCFLGELDAALAPWLSDLYRRYPQIGGGRHYWSVSWLPTTFRERFRADLNDDTQLLAGGKRLLASMTQSVPQETALADTSDGSLFATLAYLAADEKLGMLSVWSPTFGLRLLEALAQWREALADCLLSGQWPRGYGRFADMACPRSLRAATLLHAWDGSQDPEFFRRLWPQLTLVSAWDTASAAPWAQALRARLPHADFQGKGLWATEGVVTIPYADRHLLAFRSHVYEFEDVQSGRVLPPWQLRNGQQVVPLLSTGSGLLRYRMNDVLEVDGFVDTVPALKFLGRNDGADLVGEKISATFAQQILDELAAQHALRPLTLLAATQARGAMPGYVLLAEPAEGAQADVARVAVELERRLCAHFHYQLARDLGQLAAAQVVIAPELRAVYVELRRAAGMIEGNVKMEPLTTWRRPLPAELLTPVATVPARAIA